jgi:hypothetical protein
MKVLNRATISLQQGTKVLSDKGRVVELLSGVVVEAIQTADFCWTYTIGHGKQATAYTVSNGMVAVLK